MRIGSDGSSSLIGFLVATLVFTVAFVGVVNYSVNEQAKPEEINQVSYTAMADILADLILGNPGIGWYPATACVAGVLNRSQMSADAVKRFGLGADECGSPLRRQQVNNLSFDKIENLYQALLAADPDNGFVDYEEARRSLALDETGFQFHIRSWPLLASIQQILKGGYQDPNLRPLYIGDYEELKGGQSQTYLVQHQAGVTDGPKQATLWVQITNNGTTTTAFSASFTVSAKKNIVSEQHTPLLAPGQSFNVTLALNKTNDWQWRPGPTQQYDYAVRDPSKSVGEGTVSLASITMTTASTQRLTLVESGQLVWTKTGPAVSVSIDYDNLDGQGGSNTQYAGWWLQVKNQSESVVATVPNLDPKGGRATVNLAAAGSYRAELMNSGGSVLESDEFVVTETTVDRFSPALGSGEWVPKISVEAEANFIDYLVQQFDLSVPDPAFQDPDVPFNLTGDVYPDDNKFLADRLPLVLRDANNKGTLTNYNILYVGSNVDHQGMTSGSIKNPIMDWVTAGGTLIVFGSLSQNVHWLEPLFKVAVDGTSGGVYVPDQKHPLLIVPNILSYSSYDNHGTDWKFNQDQDAAYFTHVVQSGSDDILAVSNPGAFGLGKIILTSWTPYDMTLGDESAACQIGSYANNCQGLLFLSNTITVAYRSLYMDYGPFVPAEALQGVQSRIVAVVHPELERKVEIYVLLYVFR